MHAYEVGYKFENRHFSNEAAAFLYNYKNLQVRSNSRKRQAYIVNAAQSRIYGLEDNFHFELNEHFQVNAAGAWTHARYLQFGTVVNGVNRRSADLRNLPRQPAICRRDTATATGIIYDYVNTSTILHQVPMQHAPDYTATLGPRVSTGMTTPVNMRCRRASITHRRSSWPRAGASSCSPLTSRWTCAPNGRLRRKNTMWLCSAKTSPTIAGGTRSSTTASASVRGGARPRYGVLSLARKVASSEGKRHASSIRFTIPRRNACHAPRQIAWASVG